MHAGILTFLSGAMVAHWYESWENPVVFCYLIGLDLFALLRAARLAPVPATQRNPLACLRRCANFSAPSTMWKA